MNVDEMVLRSHPGSGLVARFPSVVMVAIPTAPHHDAVLNQLLALAEGASGTGPTPGRRLARQIAGLLGSSEAEDVPAFGLLAQADSGMVIVLHGAMDAEVSWPQGTEHLSGVQVATWVDRVLPPPIIAVVMAPTGPEPVAPDPRYRLGGGVVAGSGLTLLPAGGMPSVGPDPGSAAAGGAGGAPAAAPGAGPAAAWASAPPAGPEVAAAPFEGTPWPPPDAAEWLPAAEELGAVVAPSVPPDPWTTPEAQSAPALWPDEETPLEPEPAVARRRPTLDSEIPLPEFSQGVASVVSEEPPTALATEVPPPPSSFEEPSLAEPQPFIAVALAEPAPEPEEARAPLPIAGEVPPVQDEPAGPRVRGVICSRGHFNDPAAPFCGVCGISMVQRTLNLVEGPRPPLGVIVFDDGTTFTLDSDYVLGREPENDPAVVAGTARPLAVADPDRTVSRVHADLILDGWNVKAIDRGSANGTFVAAPGDESWVGLVPNKPTPIQPGTRVRLGQRVFLFDSHQGIR